MATTPPGSEPSERTAARGGEATAPRRPPRWRRRLAWALGTLVVLLLVLVIAAGSGLWWTLRHESGTAWVLTHVPGLRITGGKGTLWGDYEADRIEFALPGGGQVVMLNAGWHGLRARHAPWTLYRTQLTMDELHAQRVDVVTPASGAAKQPAKPPADLRLPVQVDIGRVQIAELHAAALGPQPLRDVRAGVHLGAERGSVHRIDDASLAWERLRANGTVRIGTTAPFALDARVSAAQSSPAAGIAAWHADATLQGPLAEPAVRATLRVQGTAQKPAQSLDLVATLRPFDAWPLGELQASTRALDLSALSSGAPVTSLSGDARAQTSGIDKPATVTATFTNAAAGRWNEGRVPVRAIEIQAAARPNDPRTIDVSRIALDLGTPQHPRAGRVQGQGRWTRDAWSLDATLADLQPNALDARAPAMTVGGPITASGSGFAGPIDEAVMTVEADLRGAFAGRGPARNAHVTLDARGTLKRIELRRAQAQAGGARADLEGVATHPAADAPWQFKGRVALADFDPAPWWPGRDDSPLRKGPNRLQAKADVDLAMPLGGTALSLWDRLGTLRGHADVVIDKSVLAGVPVSGQLALRSADAGTVTAAAQLDAAGNRVRADGRLARQGAGDRWDIALTAPALAALAPLLRLGPAPSGESALAGALNGTAHIEGRWPAIATRGDADATALRIGQTRVQSAQAHWQVDTTSDARVDVQASLAQLDFSQAIFKGTPPISSAQLQVKGTLRAHTLELRADTRALPPAWTDTLQAQVPLPGTPSNAASAGASAQAASVKGAASAQVPPVRAATAAQPFAPTVAASGPARTVAVLVVQGGATMAGASRTATTPWTGWRGSLQQLELRSTDARLAPWLRVRDVVVDTQWSGGPAHVEVQPGRAEVLGAALRWSRIAWQAGSGTRAAQLDARAELEPVALAPLLARAQPSFGWGGDLAVAGHLNVQSAPTFRADVVLERQRGDLTVTDEAGNTQALGLTDLRVGLDAHDGVWSLTQGLAGKTLGIAAGAVVARTSPQATWPAPDTPIQGVLEVQVANLGTWGPWVPAGWRLGGAVRTSASIGGRLNAPEYTGEVRGSGISVRNLLQGVAISDGEVAIALQGPTARIERFTARAGNGSVKLEGNATLGEAPQALLSLQADTFQLLGRVDRRIVTSGQAQLKLDRKTVALDGKFRIDEGLIDFTRSDAPRLSEDVHVVRGASAQAETVAANGNPAPGHDVKLDLQVALGERLRLRGRGIDTALRGELHLTSPGNRLAVAGTVRAEEGTYAAYGQKLTIDRGLVIFNGAIENPRLDIEATRPNTDVRVGVLVSGTALAPRVRLFSEPEMSEMDKLSWLVLGRAGDTLGGTDTALLQRAALALLAGEGGGMSGQFTKALGLDEVSLRQTEGDVKETVVSLGKQVSQRWYVGYERSLTTTTGSWQLIYRIARRFTLRAQTGEDSSLDVIWTWRWQ